jgi:hypothetical protein
MQLLDQPRVRHAAGLLASVPTYASATTEDGYVRAHARAPTHDKRLGSQALARLAVMNRLSSFSRPSFLLSVLSSTHACAHPSPLNDGTS